jgi:hypothetical protein
VPFSLSDVVPWGRNFEEYCSMFALSPADLSRRILGCGDGPASFNAVGTGLGCRIVSVDSIYQFSVSEIRLRIEQTTPVMVEQTRRNAQEFCWTRFHSVEDLLAARLSAMSQFLDDFAREGSGARYIAASLPSLPFHDSEFELALCSHFLFLYSEHFDAAFHIQSIVELARIAQEVRIFPLYELGTRPSRHLDAVIDGVRKGGLDAECIQVPYEFQKGADHMLRVGRRQSAALMRHLRSARR